MPVQRLRTGLAAMASLLLPLTMACQTHDLGTLCALDNPAYEDQQTTWIVGEEPKIVEEQILQDGTCESFVCLNHEGIPPYCSRPCSKNQPCPDGFECTEVQTLGPRSDDAYCVFASCETASDCKDVKSYDCVTFDSTGLDPTATFKRCQLRTAEQ